MKNLVLIIIFFPLIISSQQSKDESEAYNISTVNSFINSFYQSHNNPTEMVSYFDESFYASLYRFVEHMNIKNKRCGEFLEKYLITNSVTDKNSIILEYKIKYEKCYMTEKIELKRGTDNSYKIFSWLTYK
jgi:hypothetical protein